MDSRTPTTSSLIADGAAATLEGALFGLGLLLLPR
jgi:hypothetical protein